MIHSAYLRNPVEFLAFSSNFERLAKLQHYGLPTRLLDVTMNPLVALYFACQPYDEISEDEETGRKTVVSTDGAVFYKRAYGKGFQDIEVETVSFLASRSIQGDLTLKKLLNLLEENRLYSSSAARECRNNDYGSLVQTLQNNYFVISTLNNERLARQSGAFLLPSQYNIIRNSDNVGLSLIQRAVGKLTDEFEEVHFVIPSEKKAAILDDLDFCNINEGALFPELEHQMAYIKQIKLTTGIPSLGQFNKLIGSEETVTKKSKHKFIKDSEAEKIFADALSQHIAAALIDDAMHSLKGDLCLDWYQKESVLSTMRLHLTKLLSSKPDFDRTSATQKSKEIMNEILLRIK